MNETAFRNTAKGNLILVIAHERLATLLRPTLGLRFLPRLRAFSCVYRLARQAELTMFPSGDDRVFRWWLAFR